VNRILKPISYVLAAVYFLVDAVFIAVAKPVSDWLAKHLVLRKLSYAGFWVTRRSGGVVCRHADLDAVVESDTCNHLRQLICAFEPPPGF
jgi:hypothetical protein